MNWQGRRVLVTGATGFIGGHLVERLVREGAHVRALARYESGLGLGTLAQCPREVLDAVELVRGNILEPEGLEAAVAGMDCVFHLAAIISIPYSYRHPRETLETNAIGTLNVLSAARRQDVARVVVTSTSEVYGSALRVPIDEEHPLQAQSPYAASKIAADKIAESFYLSFDTPVAIARPFNTYGPRQSLRAVIPTIVAQALRGGEIRLGDTSTTRDFTFVADTVEGFLRIAACDAALGKAINVGTGVETSIGELANTIISLVGTRCTIVQEPERMRPPKSEVRRLCAGNRRAVELLGWSPATSLREGLEATIRWFRSLPISADTTHYAI